MTNEFNKECQTIIVDHNVRILSCSRFPLDVLAVNDDINLNKILEELLSGNKKKQSLDTVIVTNTKVLPPGADILTPVEVPNVLKVQRLPEEDMKSVHPIEVFS